MGPWWIRGRMLFMSLRLRSEREEDEKRQSVFPHGQAGGLVGLDAPKRMAVQALMQEPCATDHDLSALLEAQDVALGFQAVYAVRQRVANGVWAYSRDGVKARRSTDAL